MSIDTLPINNESTLDEIKENQRRESTRKTPSFRTITIKVIVPGRAKHHSISDMELMLVSLRNAMSVCAIYTNKVERALQKCHPD
ncbi:MAG: hypothetical protein ACFFEA_01245 [Candidatus Thorarchaeota archaeon]